MHGTRWMVMTGGGLVCLLISAFAAMVSPSSAPALVRADQASDANLAELAQRYILRDGPGQIDLIPGQIPTNLPLALSLPAGNRLVGSVARRVSARDTTWDILFDTTNSPDDVTGFYERELQSSGWATPKPIDYKSQYIPSGFQNQRVSAAPTRAPLPTRTPSPNAPRSITLCPSSGDTGMTVTARLLPSGTTGVTVHLDAYSTRCTYQQRGTPTAAPPRSLPALTAPADVAVSVTDYEELGDNVSDATVTSDLSPAQLEALYGSQLQAAGWTRITGDARGPLAWSEWSTPDGKQGYLSVLEIAGQSIRDVHIQIDSLSS